LELRRAIAAARPPVFRDDHGTETPGAALILLIPLNREASPMRRVPRIALLVSAFTMLSVVSSADRLHALAQNSEGSATAPWEALTGPPAAVLISSRNVEGIIGKDVRSIANEDMGRIVEIVVDRTGQVRAAVIDFGGFLGVGSRKIAVDWTLLQFNAAGDPHGRITLKLTQDQVRTAPEYKPGKSVVVVSALDGPSLSSSEPTTPEW
jgi:hypothetical protein